MSACPICTDETCVNCLDKARRVSDRFPVFPDIGCGDDCGFVRAGVGFQCREGTGCGHFIGPPDEHYAALSAFHDAAVGDEPRAAVSDVSDRPDGLYYARLKGIHYNEQDGRPSMLPVQFEAPRSIEAIGYGYVATSDDVVEWGERIPDNDELRRISSVLEKLGRPDAASLLAYARLTCRACSKPLASVFRSYCDHGGELCWDEEECLDARPARERYWDATPSEPELDRSQPPPGYLVDDIWDKAGQYAATIDTCEKGKGQVVADCWEHHDAIAGPAFERGRAEGEKDGRSLQRAETVPCRACGWNGDAEPDTDAEPPIVKGALDAQEEAERRAFEARDELNGLRDGLTDALRFVPCGDEALVSQVKWLAEKVADSPSDLDSARGFYALRDADALRAQVETMAADGRQLENKLAEANRRLRDAEASRAKLQTRLTDEARAARVFGERLSKIEDVMHGPGPLTKETTP